MEVFWCPYGNLSRVNLSHGKLSLRQNVPWQTLPRQKDPRWKKLEPNSSGHWHQRFERTFSWYMVMWCNLSIQKFNTTKWVWFQIPPILYYQRIGAIRKHANSRSKSVRCNFLLRDRCRLMGDVNTESWQCLQYKFSFLYIIFPQHLLHPTKSGMNMTHIQIHSLLDEYIQTTYMCVGEGNETPQLELISCSNTRVLDE